MIAPFDDPTPRSARRPSTEGSYMPDLIAGIVE
jgi:hypothetical protein